MGRVVTHKKSGDLAVAGVVVRAVSCGVVQVQWRGTSAITNCNLHCVEISSRVGDAVLLHGVTPATVFGFRYNPHQELLYDLRVWDPGSQSSFTVLGVAAGDATPQPCVGMPWTHGGRLGRDCAHGGSASPQMASCFPAFARSGAVRPRF